MDSAATRIIRQACNGQLKGSDLKKKIDAVVAASSITSNAKQIKET